jgi:hypothetical protein
VLNYKKVYLTLSSYVVIGIFFSLYVHLNSQNLFGPQSLFMDEKLIYDGVINILSPTDFKSFCIAVVEGGDIRYGRLLWNLIALFSFVPYKIWGISSIIFIERMVGAIALLIAFFILSRLYVKTTTFQVILLIGLFTLPFTIYYATTPKPEPLMLMFLSLFLHRLFKTKEFYGSHWIFLGIVVGLKISGLFILAGICFILFSSSIRKKSIPNQLKILTTIGSFAVGVSISIPTLYILGIFGLGFLLFSSLNLSKLSKASALILLFSILIFTAEVSLGFARNYIVSTFGGTSHGSDSDSVNIVSWGDYIFKTYFNSSQINLFLVLILFIWGFQRFFLKRKFEPLEPLFIGISLFVLTTIPIILFVQRLWGFYLWIGFVFLVCTFARIIELSSFNPVRLSLGLLIWVLIITYQGNNPLSSFRLEAWSVSNVENSSEFKLQGKRYDRIIEILRSTSLENDMDLKVAYDPGLWVPASTSEFSINLFWGPFTNWQENYDLIILTSTHTTEEIGPSNRETPQRLLEIRGLKQNLIGFDEECRREFCYFLYKEFDGVSVLKRM